MYIITHPKKPKRQACAHNFYLSTHWWWDTDGWTCPDGNSYFHYRLKLKMLFQPLRK